jgi:hypothetical protein
MSFSLDTVRYLFRNAFKSVFESVGTIENVFAAQNESFQPKPPLAHFTEHVSILSERMQVGGMFAIVGRACYEVNIPSGSGASSGEVLARRLAAALPVGDYLRDDSPPEGTGCSLLVLSAQPVNQRKNPTLVGWYSVPVEISWQSFYFR